MKNKLNKWTEEYGERLMALVGIEKGQTVADIGCGTGNYSIPAALLVGRKGLIYAVDDNKKALDVLMSRSKSIGLSNIQVLHTSFEANINLAGESVDAVLIYDVLHHYYFPFKDDRRKLLREAHRILRSDGILSVYPTHLESYNEPNYREVIREIHESNFRKIKEFNGLVMFHNGRIEEGSVINFRRMIAAQY